MKTVYSWNS